MWNTVADANSNGNGHGDTTTSLTNADAVLRTVDAGI
jgi:hypothetical protein